MPNAAKIATVKAALAAFSPAELIETLVLGALSGHSVGAFGEAERDAAGVFTFETAIGTKGKAWGVATDGMHGGWMVQLEGKPAVGPDYLLEAAHTAMEGA